MNTGKAIIVALAMAEKSRAELAVMIGLAPETVHGMCRKKDARVSTMEKIAKALNMKTSALISLGEDK